MNRGTRTLQNEGYGLLPGATQNGQSVTSDWEMLQPLIDGVHFKEVRHVPKENGHLTEIWRSEWPLDGEPVDHVFQVYLNPGGISAWHTHQLTIDRLFANQGLLKIVLYDGRKDSSTFGRLNIFRVGTVRPTLVVVPAGVWHGVENLADEPALLLNLTNRMYRYEDPDHWRLPPDTDQIPYRFVRAASGLGNGSI